VCLPVRGGELLCVWCLCKVLRLARLSLASFVPVATSLLLATSFVPLAATFKIIVHRNNIMDPIVEGLISGPVIQLLRGL